MRWTRSAACACCAAFALAALAGACGSSSSSAAASTDDASLGPIPGAPVMDDTTRDAAVGNPMFTASADAGDPLQVHIQVNGGGNVCGACAIVLAQAQGGTQPYHYAWSDPSWQGAGPFQVCPQQSTPVAVTVTDSSSSSGEVTTPDQSAKASTSVECYASDGSVEPGALNGCIAEAATGVPDAGSNDAGLTECHANEVEAGVAWADGGAVASEASTLGVTFKKGHTYSVSYDRLLPIVLGQPVTVDVFGSTEPDICKADQKLFTLNLDGSLFNWHQAYCFTPDQDYDYTVTNVYIQGVYFFFNPLTVGTICDTCSM